MKSFILLSCMGVIALLSELFNFKKRLFPIIIIGLLGVIVTAALDWNTNISYYNDMVRFDNYSILFSGIIISIAILWFFMSESFFQEITSMSDHYAVILFSLVGAMALTAYSNLTMLFLGIEILSISMYIMAGSNKNDLFSNEAAFKYFLLGAFATGFLLFGIALIYGSTGSFHLTKIAEFSSTQQGLPSIFYGGIIMILVGLSFKVSAAPFHFWAPDVYQGSPTMITAFMSTIVKAAAFAAFFRLFSTCFSQVSETWNMVVWGIAALTLMVGNITAVYQSQVKRMLAYSSIAHAGYMMLAIIAMNKMSAGAITYYTAAYSIASLTAFAILHILLESKGEDKIENFNGLAKNNPWLAGAMTVSLLSLAGIPPLAGFFAKYYIFSAAINQHYTGLVIIAVIGSLIGVYYYFKILIAMFLKDSLSPETYVISGRIKFMLILSVIISLVLGLFPDLILSLV